MEPSKHWCHFVARYPFPPFSSYRNSPWKINVRLGDTNLRSTSDDYVGIKDIAVQDIVIHESFTGVGPFEYDVAILRLSKAARSNAGSVCHVCLPAPGERTDEQRCVATGYGKLSSRDKVPLMRLKEVVVPVMSYSQCAPIMRGLLGRQFKLPNTFVCAGGNGGADACEVGCRVSDKCCFQLFVSVRRRRAIGV